MPSHSVSTRAGSPRRVCHADAQEVPRPGLRIGADREDVERGLVTLGLTLVELLRQLMERQSLRRVEQGDLSEDKIEEIGQTLMALDQRMSEIVEQFGLTREDLNLDLGPLGP